MTDLQITEKGNKLLRYFALSFAIILFASIIICIIDNLFGISESVFDDLKEGRNIAIDFFLVEVQVSFITLSLSTALSASSKQVYWEETYKYRLISPKYTNFTALSAYILASLLDGLILCFIGWPNSICTIAGIFFSFLLSVIFLIILSARMIDANFGRERIKRELEQYLKSKCDALPTAQHIGMDKGRMLPEIHKLMQVTIQEIDQKELDLACENMLLLADPNYKNEFMEVYAYAKSAISSETVIKELDYLIMKQIVSDNRMDFFYVSCPIPEQEQYDLWELVIHDIFDEAKAYWKSGNKEKALDKRRNLYIMLTKYLSFKLRWVGAPLYDEENDETVMPSQEEMDKELSRILYLMALFVSRRQNTWYGLADDGLDKSWEESERKLTDDKEFVEDYEGTGIKADPVNILDELVEKATEVLDTWDEDRWAGCTELEDYSMMDLARHY